jgi:regulator of sirC expression with transglutaminase-like and TPR domain
MRPKISYDTKRKLDQLVDELRDPVADLDTDEQVRVLIRYVVDSEYGYGPNQKTVPPWERDKLERKIERRRKRQREKRDRMYGR